MIYENIPKNEDIVKAIAPCFNINYIEGPKVEIVNGTNENFEVEFIDSKNNKLEHTGVISGGCWIKANKRYFVDWDIQINKVSNPINLKGKKVYISIDSSSLGDTLAWFPYVEEFRKKHDCKVVCSTFINYLFCDNYPDIEFVSPGSVVKDILAMYNIGWYYNEDQSVNLFRNTVDFKQEPLQKTASNILGLDFCEIKPKLNLPKKGGKKQICIAIHSTTQAKYWNNPGGWQKVVNYVKDKGYDVILLSKEGSGYMGNSHPKGITKHPEGSLTDVIKVLRESKLFIGIGSGLSWLSWACEIPTVIISGFSEAYTEPQENVVRIGAPEKSCSGCFNKHVLDPGDWMWCPEHRGTGRQFECTKLIEGEDVINNIKHLL